VSIAYVVVAVVLALGLVASARGKLVGDPRIVTALTGVGVPRGWFPWLATAEIAGGLGLLAGIAYRPLGIAAAIGVVLYFAGAVITHVRAGDTKGLAAPGVILVVSAAALTLGALSA